MLTLESMFLLAFPTFEHESLKRKIFTQISVYLENSSHEVYTDYGLSLSSYLPQIKELDAFQKHFKKNFKKGTEDDVYLIPDI
jgi:hypothetical protein